MTTEKGPTVGSHYETLGIQPDATPEEVKAAYRRKAQKTHPDRGGNEEEFKKAGKALEVLSDPKRRASYDQHGDDGDGSPGDPRATAESVLADLFGSALEKGGNVVASVMAKLQENAGMLMKRRGQALEKRGQLLMRRPKVTTKAGTENIFAKVVDKKVAALDAEIAGMDGAAVISDLMLKMMDDYSDSEPVVATFSGDSFDSVFAQALRGRPGPRTWGA